MQPRKPKPLIAFFRNTFQMGGYRQTKFIVYEAPQLEEIDTLIASCDRPHHYQTEQVAESMKAHYTRMREDGVAHVVDTMFGTRVEIRYQHYKGDTQFCQARIELRQSSGSLERDFKLYRRIAARMKAADRYHGWETPSALVTALARMGGREVSVYDQTGHRSELVYYAHERSQQKVAS